MFRSVIAFLVLGAGLSGCLQMPAEPEPAPCARDEVAPDGTLIPAGEPYWTLQTDNHPILDGEDRVKQIPGLTVKVDGHEVEMVTQGAVVDGQDWMDRRWACHLGKLPVIEMEERSSFYVEAGSEDAEEIRVSFTYRYPDGRDIGVAPDPVWESDEAAMLESLPEIREGRHDVFAGVAYPDGSRLGHRFVVEFRTDGT